MSAFRTSGKGIWHLGLRITNVDCYCYCCSYYYYYYY